MTSRLALPVLALSLALLACASVPETRYYSLERTLPERKARAEALELSLGVRDFAAEGIYSRDNLLYREGAYEIKPDYYRRWSLPPHKLLAEATLDYFRALGLFREVYRLPYMGRVDMALEGRIVRFEHVTGVAGGPVARVELEFSLSDTASRERLWRAEVSSGVPLGVEASANDIVAAMQKAVDSCLEQAAGSLSEYLSSASFSGR